MIPIGLNQTITHPEVTSIVQNNNEDALVGNGFQGINLTVNQNESINLKQRQNKKGRAYLHIKTVHKMVLRFLLEKQMPEEKLAKILGITVRNLKQFYSTKSLRTLIPKINLSLVKLYCSTKFKK